MNALQLELDFAPKKATHKAKKPVYVEQAPAPIADCTTALRAAIYHAERNLEGFRETGRGLGDWQFREFDDKCYIKQKRLDEMKHELARTIAGEATITKRFPNLSCNCITPSGSWACNQPIEAVMEQEPHLRDELLAYKAWLEPVVTECEHRNNCPCHAPSCDDGGIHWQVCQRMLANQKAYDLKQAEEERNKPVKAKKKPSRPTVKTSNAPLNESVPVLDHATATG